MYSLHFEFINGKYSNQISDAKDLHDELSSKFRVHFEKFLQAPINFS